MLGNVTKLLDNLNTAVNDMGVVFDGIQTTVSDTTESLEQIQTVIDNVSTKLTELINRLESAEDDEKVDALLKFLQGDPEDYGAFFAEPVQVTTQEIYAIANYGSAMTPFYSVLALWVGGTILVALIKVKPDTAGAFQPEVLSVVLRKISAVLCVWADPGGDYCSGRYLSAPLPDPLSGLILADGSTGKLYLYAVYLCDGAGFRRRRQGGGGRSHGYPDCRFRRNVPD